MKANLLLFFLLVIIIIKVIEARRGKLKIGRKIKRLFVGKKHHLNNNRATSMTTTMSSLISLKMSIRSSISSELATVSIPYPTSTTFGNFPPYQADSEVYITLTDRNYNYFLGYPTALAGVNYYRNPRFLVAGRRPCGCCDNKIIIVTKAPDERII